MRNLNTVSLSILLSISVNPAFSAFHILIVNVFSNSGIIRIALVSLRLHLPDHLYFYIPIYLLDPLYLFTFHDIDFYIWLAIYVTPTLHVHMPIFYGVIVCLML